MYQSVLGPQQAYNQMGYQAGIYNQANRANMFGSLLGAGTTLGAAWLLSSKDYKKDIKPQTKADEERALKLITKTKSYKYKYKPEIKLGNEIHLGTIAEESPKEFSNGKMINLGDKVELHGMAIKALARKIQRRKSA